MLTLLTFWMCGGWAWVWLVIAASNRRQVQTVDAYGNVIARRTGGTQWDQQAVWIVIGTIAAIVLLLIILGAIFG